MTLFRRARWRSFAGAAAFGIALVVPALGALPPSPAYASVGVKGTGSSFAGIELNQWSGDVAVPPYNLNVNWSSTSSSIGREDFYQHTVDFAVSDIRYNSLDDNTNIPAGSSFEYVPVTAGGVAFMYNLPGFGVGAPRIKLSSRSACGIFTGAISSWNDPAIAADNPGVTLPNLAVHPVMRNDGAGTTFVLEEWCIAEQPALYNAFAQEASKDNIATPDSPTSTWPIFGNLIGATGSDGVAATVANPSNAGYITAVEPGYADLHGFPYASVQNDTGAYVQPTPPAVGEALSFATQLDDGTHQLNFTPGDPKAYNPSTYSYLLLPLTGITTATGATLTSFADYVLTIGQTEANSLSYASIGSSLENYGLNRIKAVPGYVGPTSAETAAISTKSITQQGSSGSSPSTTAGGSGTTQTTSGGAGGSAGSSGGGSGGSSGSTGSATTGGSAGTSGGSGGTSGGSSGTSALGGGTGVGTAAGVGSSALGAARGTTGLGAGSTGVGGATSPDANATLSSPTTGPLGQTGVESDVVGGLGVAMLVVGETGRRRWLRRRRTS